jgi:hypothetical protein
MMTLAQCSIELPNVQESDTTKVESGNAAKYKKIVSNERDYLYN